MADKKDMDEFTRLVENLKDGTFSLTHVQNAIRQWVRESENIPVEAKSILAGGGTLGQNNGLIYDIFTVLKVAIGGMELAVRRSKQEENITM